MNTLYLPKITSIAQKTGGWWGVRYPPLKGVVTHRDWRARGWQDYRDKHWSDYCGWEDYENPIDPETAQDLPYIIYYTIGGGYPIIQTYYCKLRICGLPLFLPVFWRVVACVMCAF